MEQMLAHFAGRVKTISLKDGVTMIIRSVSTKMLVLFLKHLTL